jgi:drug/metabolite transporter (DMT)-like permease
MDHRRDHLKGVILVTMAAIVWSSAGIFMRLLDLDLWTMQAWRSVFGALSMVVLLTLQYGARAPAVVRAVGWPGVAAVLPAAVSMFAFVAAMKYTTVANVMVVYATIPFVAAAIAFVWIREKISRRTAIASAVALLGIAVMGGTATRPGDLIGNAIALVMTVTFAILVVMARRYRGLSMLPTNAMAAALCAIVCFPLAAEGVPPARDLAILAAFGAMTMGLAYFLYMAGGRLIPASETGLIGLIDVVLAPLWVYLLFAEDPGLPAVIGGGLVLGAVVWYLAGPRPVRSATTAASG